METTDGKPVPTIILVGRLDGCGVEAENEHVRPRDHRARRRPVVAVGAGIDLLAGGAIAVASSRVVACRGTMSSRWNVLPGRDADGPQTSPGMNYRRKRRPVLFGRAPVYSDGRLLNLSDLAPPIHERVGLRVSAWVAGCNAVASSPVPKQKKFGE